MTMLRYAAVAAAAVSLGWSSGTVAETIKLTVVGAPPPLVANVKLTKEFFVPEVDRRLAASGHDFKIEWRQAYAESLAKFTEVFETVETGIANVGVQIPPFEASKLPLEQYSSQIPFGVTDPGILTAIDAVMHQKVPEMAAAWKTHNQIHLGGAAPDGWLLATKDPIHSVDDMKGLKIGTAGPSGEWLRGTGAVRVNIALGQSYADMRNGVYQGVLTTDSLSFPFKIYEAAKNMTDVGFGCSIATALSVNLTTWTSLPAFARKIFADVAKEWTLRFVQLTNHQQKAFHGMMVKAGAKYNELPQAERVRWAKTLPNIPKQWSERMAEHGLPGAKIVQIYLAEARARGVKLVRDWDKE